MLMNTSWSAATLVALCASAPFFWQDALEPDDVYAIRREVHGIEIKATAGVDPGYVDLAEAVYLQMTAKQEPHDLRAMCAASGFKILLLTEGERFLDLPEYEGQGREIEYAGGLGGQIGEFFIGVRVGSPHVLVHELGHGLYHSGIQFAETGGATDEEAWYESRTQAVYDLDFESALEGYGEGKVHEVLLAEEGTFSAKLAAAWKNAHEAGIWRGTYAGSEPNEYWAEGVTMWFRAYSEVEGDTRAMLREKDRPLFELCASLFPDDAWSPEAALRALDLDIVFEDGDASESADSLQAFLGLLDRNGDGKIGRYEGAEAMLWLTSEVDADGDDALDADELEGLLGEVDRPMNPRAELEAELREFLAEFDRDGDGALVSDELPDEDMEAEFRHLDANGDGRVTEAELLALVEEEMQEASFEVAGTDARMSGVIGPSTPGRVLELVLEHPQVRRIVLDDVPGSMDDPSNLRAARMIHRLGIATHVHQRSEIASGGVDFFLAGTTRTIEKGARIGVHSWAGGGATGRLEGSALPKDHPEHELFLSFYADIDVDEAFYWYTLEAAPADDIHWMTDEELTQYKLRTDL